MLSFRFRAMYRNLGLSRPEAAQILHVSERTVQNWESGQHEIPYTAYKLLRILTRQELPGAAWAGWHVTAGVLWSPEGHGFKPQDSNWWSLLCRRARLFHDLYRQNVDLRTELGSRRAAAASAARREAAGLKEHEIPVTPHPSPMGGTNDHFLPHRETEQTPFPVLDWGTDCPAETRLGRARQGRFVPQGGAQ